MTTALTLEYCPLNRLAEQQRPALTVFLVPSVVIPGTRPVSSDLTLAGPVDWRLKMPTSDLVARQTAGRPVSQPAGFALGRLAAPLTAALPTLRIGDRMSPAERVMVSVDLIATPGRSLAEGSRLMVAYPQT